MKSVSCLLFLFMSFSFIYGQGSDDAPSRKGMWLVETGSSISGGIGPSSTGGNLLSSDGTTLMNLGVQAGKFISNDLAWKLNLGLSSFSSGFGDSSTFLTIMGGAKYYISSVAPIDLGVGVFAGEGGSTIMGRATIGYGIRLADNINFEPAGGVLIADGSTSILGQLSFSLFL